MKNLYKTKHKYGISDNEGLNEYDSRKTPEFNRRKTIDTIGDMLQNINWENESKYHNTYYVNGKYNVGRTIKLKNK